MASWKEGDRVKIVSRAVTAQDKLSNRYFEHMAGLTGTVQNVYSNEEIAIKIDLNGTSKVTLDVHKQATLKMREKFLGSIGEDQKKQLTAEELSFEPHYMLLLRAADLEKAP